MQSLSSIDVMQLSMFVTWKELCKVEDPGKELCKDLRKEQTIRGRLSETALMVHELSSGVVMQVVSRATCQLM